MTCPDGGQFFICTNIVPGGFVGCCNTANACTKQGCGSASLEPAGWDLTALNGTIWNQLSDQKCDMPKTFYSCNLTQPSFWGCCNSDPCRNNGVCPTEDLEPASLGANPFGWNFFTVNNASSQPSGVSTGISMTTGSSNIPTTSDSAVVNGITQSSTNVGAIAGGVVGGVILLLAIVAGIWLCRKKRASRQPEAVGPGNVYADNRYSGVPTLVPSNHPGSPRKSLFGGSPDPNQYSYESTPRLGGSSIAGHWQPSQGYERYPDPEAQPTPQAWGNAPMQSPQMVELGGAPVYPHNELPGE